MSNLFNKNVLLGVSGSIAAYKSAEIIRRLQDCGAVVKVILTKSGREFITPLTMQALSRSPIHTELLDETAERGMSHIALARWADILLIAPASANVLARIAQGRAEDLLSTVCLATSAKVLLAPAMNHQMWLNVATQKNMAELKARGFSLAVPAEGEQACGENGPGRMLEPEDIISLAGKLFTSGALLGKSVLITAGPTREPLDPIRYLTNYSSGKMGFMLCEAAVAAGAKVSLVAGPVNLDSPEKVTRRDVETAEDMLKACLELTPSTDIFISCAAVADYRPAKRASQKIKKENVSINLPMVRNPDILSSISALPRDIFCVGFAAETQDVLENSRQKLKAKNLDLIIANDVSDEEIGFESDCNEVFLIWPKGEEKLPCSSKFVIAQQIINRVSRLCGHKSN